MRLTLLAALPLAALVVFFVIPVVGMVAQGFWAGGEFDPGAALEDLEIGDALVFEPDGGSDAGEARTDDRYRDGHS